MAQTYEKYVLLSVLTRGDILEKYIDEFKYCYAGLCLSNGMTAITNPLVNFYERPVPGKVLTCF